MTELIPLPYRVLLTVLFAAALVASGYVKGRHDEQDATKVRDAAVIVKTAEKIRTINASDRQIGEAYEKGKAARESEVQDAKGKLDALMQRLPVCAVPDDAVRLLNRARRPDLSPDPSQPDAAVPGPPPAPGRQPGDSRQGEPFRLDALQRLRGPLEGVAVSSASP